MHISIRALFPFLLVAGILPGAALWADDPSVILKGMPARF